MYVCIPFDKYTGLTVDLIVFIDIYEKTLRNSVLRILSCMLTVVETEDRGYLRSLLTYQCRLRVPSLSVFQVPLSFQIPPSLCHFTCNSAILAIFSLGFSNLLGFFALPFFLFVLFFFLSLSFLLSLAYSTLINSAAIFSLEFFICLWLFFSLISTVVLESSSMPRNRHIFNLT